MAVETWKSEVDQQTRGELPLERAVSLLAEFLLALA